MSPLTLWNDNAIVLALKLTVAMEGETSTRNVATTLVALPTELLTMHR